MTWQMMTRLRSMAPEELRFRSMTELRKVQGRARAAVFTPASSIGMASGNVHVAFATDTPSPLLPYTVLLCARGESPERWMPEPLP